MSGRRLRLIRSRLETAFEPERLELVDESHLHAGHAGAADGKGHFRVRIVSNRFRDTRPIQRQRMVFEALGELMRTDIHALSISAQPPSAGDGHPPTAGNGLSPTAGNGLSPTAGNGLSPTAGDGPSPAGSPSDALQSHSARFPAAGGSGGGRKQEKHRKL